VGDGVFNGRQIELKGLPVRPDLHRHAAVVIYVEFIFDEIWCEDEYFFARVEDGFQGYVEGATGAAGHNYVFARHLESGFFRQDLRYGPAGFIIPGVTHVAVHARDGMLRQFAELLKEFRGRFHVGISQGEVKDVFLSVDGAHPFALFEHLAYP